VSLGISTRLINLISKVNKHQPLLYAVGILPNQLRVILKETSQHLEEAFEDISYTLTWHGYQIWRTRKRLMSNYWKQIAPEEWKLYSKKKVSSDEKNCGNPFHFLKRHCKLSSQRITPCPCSNFPCKSTSASQDIRSFLLPLSDLPTIVDTTLLRSNSLDLFNTREDLIRREHDRRKNKNFLF
jgi:hypothetical protein